MKVKKKPILCPEAAYVARLTLKLCILLTLCRLLLIWFAPPPGGDSYYLYQYIGAYGEVLKATLLAGLVGTLWTQSASK